MGDYYKIKKILLILIIVLTIIRIFKTSNVFATEAVEVTPVWNDSQYTYQADNQYMTLQSNQIAIQDQFIYQLRYSFDSASDNNKQFFIDTLQDILTNMVSRIGASSSRWIWFSRNFDTNYNTASFYYHTISATKLSNITYADATLNDGYKLLSVPFYSFSRNSANYISYVNFANGSRTTLTSGSQLIPCAELGCYSSNWFDLFEHVGLLDSSFDYESFLSSIQETNELNYTQNYYTKQAVQNTYNYLTNDNIEEITSLGISQPQVTEQVDLTDVLDSLEALLTNETYTTKFFTITLPNGRGSTFALSPELLENNLNRVGGQNIVSIIHAVWYIGLYGWYIFSLLGIYGKLLTGDLFHLVKGCSPVTNLVKMSVGTISGGKF